MTTNELLAEAIPLNTVVVIEAGPYAGEPGVVVGVSPSGRTLDVLLSRPDDHRPRRVTVRRTSVEVYGS